MDQLTLCGLCFGLLGSKCRAVCTEWWVQGPMVCTKYLTLRLMFTAGGETVPVYTTPEVSLGSVCCNSCNFFLR